MRTEPWRLAWLFAAFSCAVAAPREDTASLAAHLKAERRNGWLPAAVYSTLQTEYLNWIDARISAGDSVEGMNRELRASGLFPRQPETFGESLNSNFAGLPRRDLGQSRPGDRRHPCNRSWDLQGDGLFAGCDGGPVSANAIDKARLPQRHGRSDGCALLVRIGCGRARREW